MSRDLESLGRDCVWEATYGMNELCLDTLRDSALEQVWQTAESATIYYADCLDIISEYENDPRVSDVEDLCDSGQTFKASEWREAMQVYAHAITVQIIEAEIHSSLEDIEAAQETLQDIGDPGTCPPIRISRGNCPYGWAPHDKSDDNGVLYWTKGQLDGMNGVSVNAVGDIWLSFSWMSGGNFEYRQETQDIQS